VKCSSSPEKQFETIYRRLGVTFDVMLGESFYNPKLADVINDLRLRGIARESEGAWCVFSDGSLPPEHDPFLIKDRDGGGQILRSCKKATARRITPRPTLATLQYRLERWDPDEIVYVTDGRQQLHFRQLFAIFRRWHPERATKIALAHVWLARSLATMASRSKHAAARRCASRICLMKRKNAPEE
jgi:arginyl-tRNA synthetase